MSKRNAIRLVTVALIIGAASVAFFAYAGTTMDVVIHTEEAQAHLDRALEKRDRTPHTVRIEEARIRFADDLISIDARVTGAVLQRDASAHVRATGTLRYHAGSFYFVPKEKPSITEVRIEKRDAPAGAFGETKALLKQKLRRFADDHGLGDVAATLKRELDAWAATAAEQALKSVLTKRPVYVLKNTPKGVAVRAVLEKVAIIGDELHVTLSLAQFGYSVFVSAALLLMALGMAGFLIRYPGWGLALAALS